VSRISAMLRARRAELGMTLADVAIGCGASISFVSDVEHGRRSMSLSMVGRVANALSIDPAEALSARIQDDLDAACIAGTVIVKL
jgi:transcriptional regulator with XRE-family HTH domain